MPCCSEVSEVSDAFFFASKFSLQASGFGRGSGGWGPDYQYYFGVFFIIVILCTPKPYYGPYINDMFDRFHVAVPAAAGFRMISLDVASALGFRA